MTRKRKFDIVLCPQVGGGMWAVVCWVAAAVGAVTGAAGGCDVADGDNTYREEVLLSDVNEPNGLALDYPDGTLYFSYQRDGGWTSATLDLKTKAFSDIVELTGSCAFTVDPVWGKVHAGCWGDDDRRGAGLYALDSNVGGFVLAGEEGRRVEFVHFHNRTIYYSYHDEYLLHAFRRGQSARVREVAGRVRGLLVDAHNDWVYHNRTGVYRQRAGAARVTRYTDIDFPAALAVDARGVVYACNNLLVDTRGVYRLHEDTASATRLVENSCCGLTIDRDDNIIYGDNWNARIIRLVKC